MEKDEAKFTIEGNPGQNNTFIHIGKAINVNPNATTVENTFYFGTDDGMSKAALKEAGFENKQDVSDSTRVTSMKYRQMLEQGIIDISKLQREIMKYVEALREYVKDDKDALYLKLWSRIMEHKVFAIDLYDRGKQDSKFNRNLVGNIMHYLDGKGFYKRPYNQSEMTRAYADVLARDNGGSENKGADDPARKGLGGDLNTKYSKVIDEILMELEDK